MGNPITERLELLGGQWNFFAADPKPRVLRWLVDVEEARLIEVFVDLQAEDAGSVPDLFVRCEQPFASFPPHGMTLVDGLLRDYEESKPGLLEAGLPANWHPPAGPSTESDIERLIRYAASLQQCYRAMVERLVLFLRPTGIASFTAWRAWLERLSQAAIPGNVRVVYLDDIHHPRLDFMEAAAAGRLHSVAAALDMPGAYRALARGAGAPHPGKDFRLHFVALSTAAAGGDERRAEHSARSALAIARAQGWPHLEGVIHMTIAGVALGAKRLEAALRAYEDAATSARAAVASEDPAVQSAGAKMEVHAALGRAGAIFSEGHFLLAVTAYETAGRLAERHGESLLAMEAWRMAATSAWNARQRQRTTDLALEALRCGAGITSDVRPHTTLPLVGTLLLESAVGTEMAVRERMVELVGDDWEQKAAAMVAVPEGSA